MAAGLNVSILTLFPDFVAAYLATSIVGRAISLGQIAADVVDIRAFSQDRHRSVDDAPYGGGAGMVLMPGPVAAALESVDAAARHVVFPSPAGRPFRQHDAQRLAERGDLVLICGRYEGLDQRVIDAFVDEELSVGDYVLSSGELAAMVIVDAAYRLLDGVLRSESVAEETFQDGLLEYPHYTRPEEFRGARVPEVLLSGHHARIAAWRREQQLLRTWQRRPDLLTSAPLTDDDRAILESFRVKEQEDGRDQEH